MPMITLRSNECLAPKNAKGADNQAFLALLREKGIPIISNSFGTLLQYDPDYEYTTRIDDDAQTMLVEWIERGKHAKS